MSIKNLFGVYVGGETKQAFNFMENYNDAHFYSTGSRYFGTNSADSDYDFFTTYNTKILSDLITNGFQEIDSMYGKFGNGTDPHLLRIFRKGKVDIQLVKDENIKQKVQEVLSKTGLLFKLSRGQSKTAGKRTAVLIWTSMFQLVDSLILNEVIGDFSKDNEEV